MSENTTIKADSDVDSSSVSPDYDEKSSDPQYRDSQYLDSAHSLSLSLGYYAVGELSIGRRENALYAYRLLRNIEKDQVRWKLGQAFCALELNLIDEARLALENIQPKNPNPEKPNSQSSETNSEADSEQQKLLERCVLRLEYMQKQAANSALSKNAKQSTKQSAKQIGGQSAKQSGGQSAKQSGGQSGGQSLAQTSQSPAPHPSSKSSNAESSKVIQFPAKPTS